MKKERWIDRLWSFGFSLLASGLVALAAYFYLQSSILSVVNETATILKIDEIVTELDALPRTATSQPASSEFDRCVAGLRNQPARPSMEWFDKHTKELQTIRAEINTQAQKMSTALEHLQELRVEEPAKYRGILQPEPKAAFRKELDAILRDHLKVLSRIDFTVGELAKARAVAVSQQERSDLAVEIALREVSRDYDAQRRALASEIERIRVKLVERKEAMLEVLEKWGEGE